MLKDALRSLTRTPGFVLVVVLTLGVGIGTSVTTFTVLQGVLWKPLPYPNAERLVLLESVSKTGTAGGVSPIEIRRTQGEQPDARCDRGRLRRQRQSEHQRRARARLRGQRERGRLHACWAPIPPALGRLVQRRDGLRARTASSMRVVISDGLWRRHFGSDPSAVGRHIQVNNFHVQIVGVLRPGLRCSCRLRPTSPKTWTSGFPTASAIASTCRTRSSIARLAPGVDARAGEC